MIRAVRIERDGAVVYVKSSAVGYSRGDARPGLVFYGRRGAAVQSPVLVCLRCGCGLERLPLAATRCTTCAPGWLA